MGDNTTPPDEWKRIGDTAVKIGVTIQVICLPILIGLTLWGVEPQLLIFASALAILPAVVGFGIAFLTDMQQKSLAV